MAELFRNLEAEFIFLYSYDDHNLKNLIVHENKNINNEKKKIEK